MPSKWTACHLLSSHTSFFFLPTTPPPQHISNLYYLTPPSSSSSYSSSFSPHPHIKKRTRYFPHIPNNNTQTPFFSLSSRNTGPSIKSPTHSVPNLHVVTAVSNARKMNVVRKSSHPKHSLLLTFTRKRRSVKICKCYLNHMGS